MTDTQMYLHDVLRRARVPMEPFDYEVDWEDQPRRFNYYPNAREYPLPSPAPGHGPTLAELLAPPAIESEVAAHLYTMAELGQLLRYTYGWTQRRLDLHRNDDVAAMPSYVRATWARGTASGGGIYPLDVYVVTDGEQGLTPGVYSWSSTKHTLSHIATGNFTGRVAQALPEGAQRTGTYLLVAIQFWRNSFKYNSFAPHVTAMDLGTILSSWDLWARGNDKPLKAHLWFDEIKLNTLLGFDGITDTVGLVVPIPMSEDVPQHGFHQGSVRRKPHQRSAVTRGFHAIDVVQREILEEVHKHGRDEQPRIVDRAYRIGSRPDENIHILPDASALDTAIQSVFRDRRSSFGRFDPATPMTQGDLRAVIDAALHANAGFGFPVPEDVLSCWVAVNNVEGLPEGFYAYDSSRGSLAIKQQKKVGQFLQRSYFLQNYDLQACAAVLAITCRPDMAMKIFGARGLRLINAMVGASTQYAYLASSALDIGCGAALGFDNTGLVEAFGSGTLDSNEPTEEWPMIILMVGPENRPPARFKAFLTTEVS